MTASKCDFVDGHHTVNSSPNGSVPEAPGCYGFIDATVLQAPGQISISLSPLPPENEKCQAIKSWLLLFIFQHACTSILFHDSAVISIMTSPVYRDGGIACSRGGVVLRPYPRPRVQPYISLTQHLAMTLNPRAYT